MKAVKKEKRKMSPKQLANLKSFKKGDVGNPNGAKAHKGPKAMLKKLTKELLKDMIEATTNGTVNDLKAIAENPKSTALQVALATSMVKMINKGDYLTLEAMLQRVVGKVKDELDVTSNGQTMPAAQVHVYLPANGRTKEENEK